MKKLIGFVAIILVAYIVYFDLSEGTLPAINQPKIEAKAPDKKIDMAYFEKKVSPGETAISIIESNLKGAIPVSIDQLIKDFKKLNKGKAPEEMQLNKVYKFPDYKEQ